MRSQRGVWHWNALRAPCRGSSKPSHLFCSGTISKHGTSAFHQHTHISACWLGIAPVAHVGRRQHDAEGQPLTSCPHGSRSGSQSRALTVRPELVDCCGSWTQWSHPLLSEVDFMWSWTWWHQTGRSVWYTDGLHWLHWWISPDPNNLEKWASRNLLKLNKENCKVLCQGRTIPGTNTCWRPPSWKAACQTKTLVDTKLNMSQHSAPAGKKANGILGCITLTITRSWREVVFPLYSVLLRPHLEYFVQFWALQYESDMDVLARVQQKIVKTMESLDQLSWRRGWESWDLSAWGKEGSEGLINVCKNVCKNLKEEGARFCSVVPRDRATGNRHKLKQTNWNTQLETETLEIPRKQVF